MGSLALGPGRRASLSGQPGVGGEGGPQEMAMLPTRTVCDSVWETFWMSQLDICTWGEVKSASWGNSLVDVGLTANVLSYTLLANVTSFPSNEKF